MRSRRAELLAALLLAACLGGAAAGARAEDDDADAAAVSAPEDAASAPGHAASSAAVADDPRAMRIESAADKLRLDPLLSGKHTEHRLRWKSTSKPDEKKTPEDSSFLNWLSSLARFLNDTSRFLFWGVIAVLVALALVSARHLVQLRTFRRRAKAESAVSHVRDLDVRPESLPDDVGAAAWALWQADQVPAALSLLYRGALSRLIHRWHVPISASTTEGECLDLARGTLAPPAQRYLTQLVRAWEANIYGNRTLSSAMGEALCTGFASRLDATAASEDTA